MVYIERILERFDAFFHLPRCPQCGRRQIPKPWPSKRGTVKRYFPCCKMTIPYEQEQRTSRP